MCSAWSRSRACRAWQASSASASSSVEAAPISGSALKFIGHPLPTPVDSPAPHLGSGDQAQQDLYDRGRAPLGVVALGPRSPGESCLDHGRYLVGTTPRKGSRVGLRQGSIAALSGRYVHLIQGLRRNSQIIHRYTLRREQCQSDPDGSRKGGCKTLDPRWSNLPSFPYQPSDSSTISCLTPRLSLTCSEPSHLTSSR